MGVWAGGLVEVWVKNKDGHGGLEKGEHVGWLFGWDLS